MTLPWQVVLVSLKQNALSVKIQTTR